MEGVGSSEGNNDDDGDGDSTELYEFDDPELWDRCAEACDALHERVTNYISNEQGKQKSGDPAEYETLATAISNVAHRARTNASGAYGRMISGLADMEKPQNVYQGFVTQPPQNSRMEPFVPTVVYDGNKQGGLEGGEFTREGFDNVGGGNAGDEGEENDMTRRK